MIVPLGPAYLELITVVDPAEAARSPGGLVRRALENGWRFAGWAVRTTDIEAAARQMNSAGFETVGPFDGARQRPDGVILRWRTLHEAGFDPAIPFVIEWDLPEREHPGGLHVAHPAGEVRIERVEVGTADPDRLRAMLGDSVLCTIQPADESRVTRLVLTTGVID